MNKKTVIIYQQKTSNMDLKVEYRIPTVQEYQLLRGTTNWDKIDDSTVSTALSNSLFAICIKVKNKVVASGRIIGDGVYFYIQDVIVLPDYKGTGIGMKVMQELENWLEKAAKPNTFIGLMAAKGTVEFYKRFNYEVRGVEKPGMFKITKHRA